MYGCLIYLSTIFPAIPLEPLCHPSHPSSTRPPMPFAQLCKPKPPFPYSYRWETRWRREWLRWQWRVVRWWASPRKIDSRPAPVPSGFRRRRRHQDALPASQTTTTTNLKGRGRRGGGGEGGGKREHTMQWVGTVWNRRILIMNKNLQCMNLRVGWRGSKQMNKWAQRCTRAKRAVQGKETCEQCEQTSEWMDEWRSTLCVDSVAILRYVEQRKNIFSATDCTISIKSE